ncbi:hypothetical protein [Haematomicrobium sanguinis]|nr:hypothetical protein [Haematomicrobium sanguinis]
MNSSAPSDPGSQVNLDRFSFVAGNDLHTVHVPEPSFHGLAA